MLRACNRVLKPGGIIASFVIAVTYGLTDRETARAIEAGPSHVEAGPGYRALMVAAGFETVTETDITDDFLRTSLSWVREWDADAAEISPIMGADAFADHQADRRRAIESIERGLLRRYLIGGRKPPFSPG